MIPRILLLLALLSTLAVGVRAQVLGGPDKDDDTAAQAQQKGWVSQPPRSWGKSGEKTPLPTAPNVKGIPWFQTLVDQAAPGSTLRPPPGNYSGPVVVNKPLIIDGGGKVTIDGGGKGTVFTLEADGATLRGVHITNSGPSHDTDDACLNVRGNRNVVDRNVIDNCLFGIDLKQSNNNLVSYNRVSSKPVELGVRGDGIRLWYSMNNRIHGNTVVDSRDNVAWYSNGNVFSGNYGSRSRYSLHFMFAHHNVVENNRFYDNAVGIYLMYNEDTVVRNNVISHANGPTGMGIGFKEASAAVIEGNEIIYCSLGLSADLSPFNPDTKIVVRNNRLAYNGIAVNLNSDLLGWEMTGNEFDGNISNVAVGGAGSAGRNVWRGNYWDDYQGFDRNNDGIGDKPYELYAYADRIWMEIPDARFFKNAPLMEALDFLERLAPFSNPTLILRDEAPLFNKPRKARK